jgi:hypothetical protein
LVIILLILVFLRTRILIAIALIKEASKWVIKISSYLLHFLWGPIFEVNFTYIYSLLGCLGNREMECEDVN